MPSKKISKKTSAKRVTKKRTKTARAKTKRSVNVFWSFLWKIFWRLALVFGVGLLCVVVYLDLIITKKFEGQKWALPAHVYTRPLDVYVGQRIAPAELINELRELGYQKKSSAAAVQRVGQYSANATQVDVYLREFVFWNETQEASKVRILWQGGIVADLVVNSVAGAKAVDDVRIEPRLFGSVSPLSHEDRSLISLDETPQELIDALLVMEDRKFYRHFGIDPLGILRAFVKNVSVGRTVQGGSTLTQQLVKNYFLSSERTVKRKLTEMMMAMLLEFHYSKEAILQAYLNEVHLGQAGNRAIHGFGLGSQFLFGRPINELDLHELAMLAGLVKGTTRYNPIRNPKTALKRRNLVLDVMAKEGLITAQLAAENKSQKLITVGSAKRQLSRSYPAFSELVREQLRKAYESKDLEAAGLRIFTTLDPRVQSHLDQSLSAEVSAIERERNFPKGTLQAAAITVRTDSGEVVAMAGARTPVNSGFNRALKAKRPIGSLIKPFVLLSALKNAPEQYQLNTTVLDEPLLIKQKGSPDWQPKNYDKQYRGQVMLLDVLAKSYNVPTVNIGMDIGLSQVVSDFQAFGMSSEPAKLPSMLLGSLDLTPMDVTSMYLTIASGGFKTPVKAVRSVLTVTEEPLERYALDIEQVVEPKYNNLISFALQEVVRSGTGTGLNRHFSPTLGLAGKTGTTNDYRDSWFAGFSGNLLTVVWLGRDDNKATGLTGSSGAARIWSQFMSKLDLLPVELDLESDVDVVVAPSYSKEFVAYDCSVTRPVPVLRDVVIEGPGLSCEGMVDVLDEEGEALEAPSPIWREKKSALNRWLGRIFK